MKRHYTSGGKSTVDQKVTLSTPLLLSSWLFGIEALIRKSVSGNREHGNCTTTAREMFNAG